jgi:hypothetical protein
MYSDGFRRVSNIAKSACWLLHVFPHGTTGRIFTKFDTCVICEKLSINSRFIKTRKEYRVLYKHFVLNYFFPENRAVVCDKVEKYCKTGQVTYDNKEHAHCMMEN